MLTILLYLRLLCRVKILCYLQCVSFFKDFDVKFNPEKSQLLICDSQKAKNVKFNVFALKGVSFANHLGNFIGNTA